MADTIPVLLEIGPKGKRVVAVAPGWPGLERGAKTEDAAVERLQSYLPRYAPVATLAGLESDFAASATVEVAGCYPGVGSTDFWGISFGFSDVDRQPMSREELERELGLMQACWAFLDETRARVSFQLQKGPRGGGKDRDRIFRHVMLSDQDRGKKLGLKPVGEIPDTPEAVRAYRDTYCASIRAFHAAGKPARTWPLRFLIRHTAYHALDHAWEMEDRDLTGKEE
jgi:hypothetical protein